MARVDSVPTAPKSIKNVRYELMKIHAWRELTALFVYIVGPKTDCKSSDGHTLLFEFKGVRHKHINAKQEAGGGVKLVSQTVLVGVLPHVYTDMEVKATFQTELWIPD